MTSAKISETPKKPVESRAASESASTNKKTATEGVKKKDENEFASELAELDNAADMEGISEGDVVASAELKSPAINVNDLMGEGLKAGEPTPKLVDPKLIKQVNEAMTLPEGVEQVEAQPMQLKDLLLQNKPVLAQANAGRSPAIDFAPAEVDSQLMNFEDFVAQKKAVTGKATAPNAYGMPAKSTMNVEALMGDKAVAAMDSKPEMMLNAEGGAGGNAQLTQAAWSMEAPTELNKVEAAQGQKIFNLNSITNKQDADSIMTQISDYIVQAKAAKEPTVNMKVQHQDLGVLDITVNRVQNDVVSIAIGTQDNASKLFLGQHRDSLLSHLSQAGVNVSDLKLEQSSNSKNSNLDQGQQHASQGQDRQFGSEQNQRRHDQQRREELWDVVREKEVA